MLLLGFEFTKRLRKLEESLLIKHQLVVICSANADVETTNLAYATGVDGFLEKPLRIQNFNRIYKQSKNSVVV